jgi:hypothetical protein
MNGSASLRRGGFHITFHMSPTVFICTTQHRAKDAETSVSQLQLVAVLCRRCCQVLLCLICCRVPWLLYFSSHISTHTSPYRQAAAAAGAPRLQQSSRPVCCLRTEPGSMGAARATTLRPGVLLLPARGKRPLWGWAGTTLPTAGPCCSGMMLLLAAPTPPGLLDRRPPLGLPSVKLWATPISANASCASCSTHSHTSGDATSPSCCPRTSCPAAAAVTSCC